MIVLLLGHESIFMYQADTQVQCFEQGSGSPEYINSISKLTTALGYLCPRVIYYSHSLSYDTAFSVFEYSHCTFLYNYFDECI